MGTIINGNKWSGACVNGNIVSGLVKNGAVFYRKETIPSVLYKRRIMEGDIFNSNSRIFSDIPDNFINEDLPNMGVIDPKQTIITGSNFNIGEIFIGGFYRVYINYDEIPDNLEGWDEQFYVYDTIFYKTTLSIKNVLLDKLTVSNTITSINKNVTYRLLYIEDPNIRPLQSTDIITKNTKFYFNFPDNLYEELIEYYETDNNTTFMRIDNSNTGSYINFFANEGLIQGDYRFYSETGITSAVPEIGWITLYNNEENIFVNESKMILAEQFDLFEIGNFTITELDTNSPIYKYILVDTTTLGN